MNTFVSIGHYEFNPQHIVYVFYRPEIFYKPGESLVMPEEIYVHFVHNSPIRFHRAKDIAAFMGWRGFIDLHR